MVSVQEKLNIIIINFKDIFLPGAPVVNHIYAIKHKDNENE